MNNENLTDLERIYLVNIKNLLPKNVAMHYLFNNIPVMSKDVFNKTSVIYAERAYEEMIASGGVIPHGFCQILQTSAQTNGASATLSTYKEEIATICATMKIDINDFSTIIKKIGMKSAKYAQLGNDAVGELSEIIRRFNARYKNEFIKKIIAERNSQLSSSVIKTNKEEKDKDLKLDSFIDMIINNKEVKKRIKDMIYEDFSKEITDDKTISDLIKYIFQDDDNEICTILDVEKPTFFVDPKKLKSSNRLLLNFAKSLNKQLKTKTPEEKKDFLKALNYKAACHKKKNFNYSNEYNQLLTKLSAEEQTLLEKISIILSDSNSTITLNNKNEFTFEDIVPLTDEQKKYIKEYEQNMLLIKKFKNTIRNYYKSHQLTQNQFMKKTSKQLQVSDADRIETEKWLSPFKVGLLIDKIDIEQLESMDEGNLEILDRLRKLLIEEGLLWAFLAGNIDVDTMAKIINNFKALYNNSPELISIDKIQEMIKKVNLYDYTNDLLIGLIGLNDLEKIINYNQFSGVTVTKEIIEKRLRKIIDLAVRSERINTSSLPFNCTAKLGDYTLQRYQNNDPAIFTSGVDTKTCFFVSVNENDFFFYSLLSKDGYVIKILNKENKLIARATCFRKNNVLMINGIRYVNNKTIPENADEIEEFKAIVKLIRLMSKKMIEITAKDECPIDYVVCNKAGILENEHFEDTFEKLNADLFREPINVYNDDWKKFVSTYDNEPEQLFQEVNTTPNHSFTTDFGSHYPAILIESRNNMGLLSPKDISYSDEESKYKRPRAIPEQYMQEEIDSVVLAKINRIRALACFNGTKEEQDEKKSNYRLINDNSSITKVILGQDWCYIVYNDKTIETIQANETVEIMQEIADNVTIFIDNEDDTKVFFQPTKKRP